GRRINIKILEIARPEVDAQLVAEDIADQLQRRASFRRTVKRSVENVMDSGAKGCRIELSGRLAGAEMARREKALAGSVPLATLRAKIQRGFTEAKTPQGHIGIKVWVNTGFYDQEEPDAAINAQTGKVPQKSKRKSKR
ncbi:MAG: 30S ribosomal protein S3, partial [Planctomycetia bacterium]